MSTTRIARIAATVVVALVADLVLGVALPGNPRPALVAVTAVHAVAWVHGARAGMVTGFVTGVVLDALGGALVPFGVWALTGTALGALAGGLGGGTPRPQDATALRIAVTGAVATPVTVLAAGTLAQATGGTPVPAPALLLAVAVGGLGAPVTARMAGSMHHGSLSLDRARA